MPHDPNEEIDTAMTSVEPVPVETPDDLLRKQATLMKEIADKAKAAYDAIREELDSRTPGGSTFHPTIVTGDPLDVAPLPVSTVVTTMPSKSLVVEDPKAFGRWLMKEYPDECEVKPTKAFMDKLRRLSKSHSGRVCGPQMETEIPGLVMGVGAHYTYVSKIDHDLMPVLFAQMRDQIPNLLELEG